MTVSPSPSNEFPHGFAPVVKMNTTLAGQPLVYVVLDPTVQYTVNLSVFYGDFDYAFLESITYYSALW